MKQLLKRLVNTILSRLNLTSYIVIEELLDQELSHGKWTILNKVMRSIRSWKLPAGDYLEFGVYQGRSFIHAYNLSNRYGHSQMNFYAFDSFEGLPKATTGEEKKYDHFSSGDFSCNKETFEANLIKNDVDMSRVSTVEGYFDSSLTEDLKKKLKIKRASVVWVDCDLYASTVPVLEFVRSYLETGSFIIFDDWFSFGGNSQAGEIRAVNEWLDRNKEIKLIEYSNFHAAGKCFLVEIVDCEE